MVNTFLIDTDYRVSASKLDRMRLGKQRVEALQILNIINDVHEVASRLGISLNPDAKILIDTVSRRYKRCNYVFIADRDCTQGRPKYTVRHKSVDLVVAPHSCVVEEDFVSWIDKNGTHRYPISQVILPTQRRVGTGFWHHPVVIMWFRYPDALKEYINAHIDEWISRGYKNTMLRYQCQDAIHPLWTSNIRIIKNYQSALVAKDAKHYTLLFPNVPVFVDYIWPTE